MLWAKTGVDRAKKKAPVLGNNLVRFLKKNQAPILADFEAIRRRFCGIPSPTLGKMSHGLWENEPPTWENEPPTTGKSATDFGKMSHRLRENQPPTRENHSKPLTLGKRATDYGKMSHGLWENEPPTLGK